MGVVLLLLFAAAGLAQQLANPENLAPYIPSPQAVVDRMLETARVQPGEMVYDLGAGDGRIVITAVQKFQARAVGIELSPELSRSTSERIRSLGLEDRARILQGSILRADVRDADVITLYLLTSSNDKLKPLLENQLKPGARVVSHDFEVRGWKPAEVVRMKTDSKTHTIYLYEMRGRARP
ncbi:MAG: methyltransferase domain-containing protein [Acidobacteria bacterium]|nr:methyltransferase domain-containing protein [Acidobacteriota bacterium]